MIRIFIALIFVFVIGQLGYSTVSIEDFLERIDKAYAKIDDLQAVVTITQVGTDEVTKVVIKALVRKNVVRIEYLKPPKMKGQIFTLEGNLLSQYIPVSNIIIKKELTVTGIPFDIFNLDLSSAIRKLATEEFALKVTKEPLLITPLTTQTIEDILGGEILPLTISLSLPLNLKGHRLLTIEDIALQNYIVEVVPLEIKAFIRQLIWVDGISYLPFKTKIYRSVMIDEEIQEVVIVTIIESLIINQGFTQEELLSLPEEARIIDTRE
jgi:outer membrane lipoprotein-sorting protein